jgi:hypothetical protein
MDGLPGLNGLQGEKGNQGFTGSKGEKGYRGPPGPGVRPVCLYVYHILYSGTITRGRNFSYIHNLHKSANSRNC